MRQIHRIWKKRRPPPRKRQRKHLHRKRREKRERHSRLVRDRERSRPTDDDDDTRVLKNCERERENFRILRTTKKRGGFRNKMRNGVKTSARTTLLPPPLLPRSGKKVDFRAGFFSTSSSANRFGVGARRALFLSLMMYVVSSLARQQSLCASFFRSIPVFGPFFFLKL